MAFAAAGAGAGATAPATPSYQMGINHSADEEASKLRAMPSC